MSIQSEITRISGNVINAFTAIANKGVSIPSGSNSDDLATLIGQIPQDITMGAVSVVDAPDSAGGTVRTITGVDISSDTVTAAHLETGYTAHDAEGNPITGVLSPGGGSGAISIVDTLDAAGGTVRTITAVNISDTTATAADVASGKYFYTANGTKTLGTASSGGSEGFPGLLLISSIFNANYNHANIYTGSETIQAYTGPVELAGGASRIQKAYVRIGPIDLTNISLIQSIISIPKVSNGTSYGRLFIGSNADDTAYSVSASQLESVTYYNEETVHDVLSLDVSGFSGEYYIFTGTDSNGSSWGNSRIVSVFAVAASADGTPVFEEEPST